ncbi:MAG: hypothetical protein ACRDZ7_10640, partial [Acidimicrobiia bacterium]
PAPPSAPTPPSAAVPEAPVSPPPAQPNLAGRLLSLVDVEAAFTGISLPWTPEAPRTGVRPVDGSVDGSRPEPSDRPGRRVWDASQERAERAWSQGRREGHETWSGLDEGS